MSKNRELVELFMSESFRTHKSDLSRYVSRSFIFKSHRYGELDFENYVKYAAKYYRQEEVQIDWIHSTDDEHFGVAYTVMDNVDDREFGVLAVTIIDDLVDFVAEQ